MTCVHEGCCGNMSKGTRTWPTLSRVCDYTANRTVVSHAACRPTFFSRSCRDDLPHTVIRVMQQRSNVSGSCQAAYVLPSKTRALWV